jgi:hypothetical protein
MKTSREDSLAVNETALGVSRFVLRNMRCGGLAALILVLSALHLQMFVPSALAGSHTEQKNAGARQWSIQVDKVDSGDVSPDPSFGAAIHENLLGDLAKSKQFRHVLRGDDRNASDVRDLLILKTTVEEYAPSSETRGSALDDTGLFGVVGGLFLRFCKRTVRGATKLNVHIQLYTRGGHLVLEDVVERDVQLVGDNSRATHNLAQDITVTLMRATLPDPAIIARDNNY